MGTQGLVTIVNNKGKVLYKVVCGCNGYEIDNLTLRIKEKFLYSLEEITLQKLYDLAQGSDFGCRECLTITDGKQCLNKGDNWVNPYKSLYTSTFSKPKFNPRWECGLVDRYKKVVVGKKLVKVTL